ncbi:MAG: phosphatase PAP2 family protein [Chloroflexi bacterium]|nr:phosphatase PAP2 family protein [Chloroflexota bacterium]
MSTRLNIAERPGCLRTLASIFAHSGDSPLWIVGFSVVWWLGNEFWKREALAALIGIFVTAAATFALKYLIRRQRPEGEWGAIYRRFDAHSFPSGHSVRMAMLATVAALLGPPPLATALVVLAALVMLARVAMGVHYLLDVAGGAVVGVIIGAGIVIML